MDDGARNQPSYCFHGAYERAVDAKGRFNLPFRFRRSGEEAGAERYVVMKGPDGQLAVLPEEVFEAAFTRLREGEPSRDKRAVLRKISAGSFVLEPDSQGRVAVPAELLASVGISKRVFVVGMADRMELFDPGAVHDHRLGAGGPRPGVPGPVPQLTAHGWAAYKGWSPMPRVETRIARRDGLLRVSLAGILDQEGLADLIYRVSLVLPGRGATVILDGAGLQHLDYRCVQPLVAWSRRLRSYRHDVHLVAWNDYLQAILAMEDWNGELDRGRQLARARPARPGAVSGQLHVPVLLADTLRLLAPGPGKRIVDGTFGFGGHTGALLAAGASVLGLDLDDEAVASCRQLARSHPELACHQGSFRSLADALASAGWDGADGLLLDLGVSSRQLDDPGKGFSYRADGPLDLRFDQHRGRPAHALLEDLDEMELATVLRDFAEERRGAATGQGHQGCGADGTRSAPPRSCAR